MRHHSVSRDEFAAFYAADKDRCLRAAIAGGMRRDQAEDAVAEAFARAWARWRTVRSHRSPAAWVVRTAVNADISWWRKRRREVFSESTPNATYVQPEGSMDLTTAIRGLPRRQREVVVLRYLLDLDTAATADELGIATGTVTAHLHHALAALREQLAHEWDTETEEVNA
jgi:RNA polymerase sigma-70 factor (sigma-E family)